MAKQRPKPLLIIAVNGNRKTIEPANGDHFRLKEMQDLVAEGGLIQVVYPPAYPGMIMICDEEGLFKSPAVFNYEATAIFGSPIVGDVIYCESKYMR